MSRSCADGILKVTFKVILKASSEEPQCGSRTASFDECIPWHTGVNAQNAFKRRTTRMQTREAPNSYSFKKQN